MQAGNGSVHNISQNTSKNNPTRKTAGFKFKRGGDENASTNNVRDKIAYIINRKT